MKTPVALIIFNRPKQTRQVFEALRQIKPDRLYVIADGPRNKDEQVLCNEARTIIDTIDWKCVLKKSTLKKTLVAA